MFLTFFVRYSLAGVSRTKKKTEKDLPRTSRVCTWVDQVPECGAEDGKSGSARTVPKTESSPTRSMFLDLFRYFAGDNSEKKEIDLTVPVNTFVQQRENDVTYYKTCLVLPAKFQSAPSKDNSPSVFLEDNPEMVILTRRVYLKSRAPIHSYKYHENGTSWKDGQERRKRL